METLMKSGEMRLLKVYFLFFFSFTENLDPYAVRCTKLEMSSSSTFPAATSATLIDNG